jgi:cysteinyl-tRNA synthetase
LEGTYSRFKDSQVYGSIVSRELEEAINNCNKNFISAMNDDFNTREGSAELFQRSRLANSFNPDELDLELKNNLLKTFETYGTNVLGLFSSESLDNDIEAKINQLISDRDKARQSKDWAKSDSIRDELTTMGIQIQDTPEETKWNRI